MQSIFSLRASSKIEVLIRTACLLCEGCFKAIWAQAISGRLDCKTDIAFPYISKIYLETAGGIFHIRRTVFENSDFRKDRFRTTKNKMNP